VTSNLAYPPAGAPQPRFYAGLAADDDGADDRRPPLVLLHGMTFDRSMWRPALDHLRRIDPGRRALALDLPGHGASAARASHGLEAAVEAVHGAVRAARLEAPVVVGHSVSGLLATLYAGRLPTRGVVNVDQSLLVAPFVGRVQALADALRGPQFDAVWAGFEAGLHAERLPSAAQELLRASRSPRQEVVLGYWREVLERPAPALVEWLAGEIAACRRSRVPYVVVAGDGYASPDRAFLREVMPDASVDAWPGTGHFPHLARPADFARVLAQTGAWAAGAPSPV
jgi:pimeloyl-ACP methyl ester carboxylesterase